MWKIRNKTVSKPKSGGAARKGSPSHHTPKLKVGQRVRIVDISPDLNDPNYDLKDADHREMRTAELFRFCLGRCFKISDFDQYGNVELHVGNSSAVRKRFGNWHTIWVEPEFVRRIAKRKK
jgi:hypothetical protein